MGFRVADTVVAIRGITSRVTGLQVTSGTQGVVLKQLGITPATYRVRFTVESGAPVVLDDVTGHDIGHLDSGLDQPIPRQSAGGSPASGAGSTSGTRPNGTASIRRVLRYEGSDLAEQT
jgi:hypothetical protein